MSNEEYLENPWIQHYLAEADAAVDAYLVPEIGEIFRQ